MKKFKEMETLLPPWPRGCYSELDCPYQRDDAFQPTPERCLMTGLRRVIDRLYSPGPSTRRCMSVPDYFNDILCTVNGLGCKFRKLEDLFSSKMQNPKYRSGAKTPKYSFDDMCYLDAAAQSLLKLITNLKEDLSTQKRSHERYDRESIRHTTVLINELEMKLLGLLKKVEHFKIQLIETRCTSDLVGGKRRPYNYVAQAGCNDHRRSERGNSLFEKKLCFLEENFPKDHSGSQQTCSNPRYLQDEDLQNCCSEFSDSFPRTLGKRKTTTTPVLNCYLANGGRKKTKKRYMDGRGRSKFDKVREEQNYTKTSAFDSYVSRTNDLSDNQYYIPKQDEDYRYTAFKTSNSKRSYNKNGRCRSQRERTRAGEDGYTHNFGDNNNERKVVYKSRKRSKRGSTGTHKRFSNKQNISSENKTNTNRSSNIESDKMRESILDETRLSQSSDSSFPVPSEPESSEQQTGRIRSSSRRHRRKVSSQNNDSTLHSTNGTYKGNRGYSGFSINTSIPRRHSKKQKKKKKRQRRYIRERPSQFSIYSSQSTSRIRKGRGRRKEARKVLVRRAKSESLYRPKVKRKYSCRALSVEGIPLVNRFPECYRWNDPYECVQRDYYWQPPFEEVLCMNTPRSCCPATCNFSCCPPRNSFNYQHIPYPMCSDTCVPCSVFQKRCSISSLDRPQKSVRAVRKRNKVAKNYMGPKKKVRFRTDSKSHSLLSLSQNNSRYYSMSEQCFQCNTNPCFNYCIPPYTTECVPLPGPFYRDCCETVIECETESETSPEIETSLESETSPESETLTESEISIETVSRGTSMEDIHTYAKRTSTTDLIRLVKAIGTNTPRVSIREIGIGPIPLHVMDTGTDPEIPRTVSEGTQAMNIPTEDKYTSDDKIKTEDIGTDPISIKMSDESQQFDYVEPLRIHRPILTRQISEGIQILTEQPAQHMRTFEMPTGECIQVITRKKTENVRTITKQPEHFVQTISRRPPQHARLLVSQPEERVETTTNEQQPVMTGTFTDQPEEYVQIISKSQPQYARTFRTQPEESVKTISKQKPQSLRIFTKQPEEYMQTISKQQHQHIRTIENQPQECVQTISKRQPQSSRTFTKQPEEYMQTISKQQPQHIRTIENQPQECVQTISKRQPQSLRTFTKQPEESMQTISKQQLQYARTFANQPQECVQTVSKRQRQISRTFTNQPEESLQTISAKRQPQNIRTVVRQPEECVQTITKQQIQNVRSFTGQPEHCVQTIEKDKAQNANISTYLQKEYVHPNEKQRPQIINIKNISPSERNEPQNVEISTYSTEEDVPKVTEQKPQSNRISERKQEGYVPTKNKDDPRNIPVSKSQVEENVAATTATIQNIPNRLCISTHQPEEYTQTIRKHYPQNIQNFPVPAHRPVTSTREQEKQCIRTYTRRIQDFSEQPGECLQTIRKHYPRNIQHFPVPAHRPVPREQEKQGIRTYTRRIQDFPEQPGECLQTIRKHYPRNIQRFPVPAHRPVTKEQEKQCIRTYTRRIQDFPEQPEVCMPTRKKRGPRCTRTHGEHIRDITEQSEEYMPSSMKSGQYYGRTCGKQVESEEIIGDQGQENIDIMDRPPRCPPTTEIKPEDYTEDTTQQTSQSRLCFEKHPEIPLETSSELSMHLTLEKIHEEIFRKRCRICKCATKCDCKCCSDKRINMEKIKVCEKKRSNTIRITNREDCKIKDGEGEIPADVEFEMDVNIENSKSTLSVSEDRQMETTQRKFGPRNCHEKDGVQVYHLVQNCDLPSSALQPKPICESESNSAELDGVEESETTSIMFDWKDVADEMKIDEAIS